MSDMTNQSSQGPRSEPPQRDGAPRGDSQQPVADLTKAPLPTSQTLRRRRSLPYQVTRFAVFNARIIRMVRKGRH